MNKNKKIYLVLGEIDFYIKEAIYIDKIKFDTGKEVIFIQFTEPYKTKYKEENYTTSKAIISPRYLNQSFDKIGVLPIPVYLALLKPNFIEFFDNKSALKRDMFFIEDYTVAFSNYEDALINISIWLQ